MTNEGQARERIDAQLRFAWWVLQDPEQINLGAGMGVAARELQGKTSSADHVLFVEGKLVEAIEAEALDRSVVAKDPIHRHGGGEL